MLTIKRIINIKDRKILTYEKEIIQSILKIHDNINILLILSIKNALCPISVLKYILIKDLKIRRYITPHILNVNPAGVIDV